MRSLFIVLAILVGFSGCVKKNKVPVVQNAANSAMHEVKVVEVIQTSVGCRTEVGVYLLS